MSFSPAIDVLRKSSNPGIPFNAVSSDIPISRSISSGLAPGFCVNTSTNGGVGSGYASTFKFNAACTPIPTSATAPRMTRSRLCKLQLMIARIMSKPQAGGPEHCNRQSTQVVKIQQHNQATTNTAAWFALWIITAKSRPYSRTHSI